MKSFKIGSIDYLNINIDIYEMLVQDYHARWTLETKT